MHPGTVVAGRYVIEGLAGSGGMSTVYKARDRNGDLIALKVLKLQAAHQVARFVRETNLLHKLRHPAIVAYLDSGLIEDTGQYFLALEWLEGKDLHSFLADGRLGVEDSLRLAERIADALGFAHAQGVVHRDVKPENIFLPGGDATKAKLLDFGIARWADSMEALTRTGARFGTPAYMSPEQVRGDRNLDARADVFSLGCVLFECITGEPAFAAMDPMAVFGKILFDDPPRASTLVLDVPESVETLLLRMLARNPAERPASGDELAAELRTLQRQVRAEQPLRRPRTQEKQHTLTDLEQRLVSVVVAMLDSAAYEAAMLLTPRPDSGPVRAEPRDTELDSGGPERTPAPAALPAGLDAAVRAELETLGARVGLLQSGLLVAVLEQRGTSMHATAADQAAQAARAALFLRREFPRALVALATGRAVIHRRGLVGEVIDHAVALLGVAGGARPEVTAGVRIDEVTAGLLGDRFGVERITSGALRLSTEPRHRSRGRTREHRSPFVGRSSELATLVATLDECLGESVARALLVTGPAGFGKSRLCQEFLGRVYALEHETGERVEVWIAHGDPMRGSSPLHLFSSALRRTADIVDSEPVVARRDKLRRRVERHMDRTNAHRVGLFLSELLKIGVPEDEDNVQIHAARRDPLLMGDQVRRACADLLDAETVAQPLLIVLEDLHWGDRATVEVLDLAMRNLSERPMLVLALGRPEVRDLFPQLWTGHNLTEIRLNRLSRRAAEKLVRAGLGDAAPVQMEAVIERGDGNPFYLEELVRRVAAGHQTLPDTVMAMVQGRLGALDPQARRVLRAASVFGAAFWRGGVVALAGNDMPVERWLETLVELELATVTPVSRFAGETEYAFRHALIGEAAYDMLTEEDRRLGHQLAGRWLAATGEQDARLLAEHFDRGGVLAEALPHYQRAADEALDRSDLDAAVAMAQRGIACGAAGATLGALLRVQMEERVWRGNPTEVVHLGDQAMQLLPHGSRAWFDVAGEVGIAHGKRDDIAQVEGLLAAIDGARDPEGTGWQLALAKVVPILFAGGHRARASELLAALEAELGPLDHIEPAVAGNVHLARAFRADTLLSDPAAVLIETEKCAACFEAIGDARQGCFHRTNVGYAKFEMGLFREAERDLRAALGTAERMAIDLAANTARKNLALTCAHQGALDEARLLGRQACRWFAERDDTRELALSRLYLATVLILDQDLDEAELEARAALQLLPESVPLRPFGLGTLARTLLLRGCHDQALEIAREAYRLLESLGNIESGESMVRLVFAEALEATGAHEHARAIIDQARDVLLARAGAISRADWRRSFLENIPDHLRTVTLAGLWTR
jgi:serine/threonine protein kinase/tetratricopeptide (TPR) repeat protein